MARKRIDSILVKEAIEKELQFMAGNLDELAAKIKSFPAIRTKTEGANNVKELSKAQIQYAESLKAVEQLVKQRMASEAKLITLQSDYAVATSKNRVEIQKMNQEQKAAAAVALSNEGSIERARAKIKQLTLEQSKLNLVTAEGRKRNDEINKSLDKYGEFIRKNVSAAEKQRLNVGNYQGSAKIIVDALERARQKVQQVERDFGKIGPEARAARGEFDALNKITQDNRFLNIAAKVGDTNKELRFFTQQLNALEDAGQRNSQVYADVRARLAQLTDQIADTKAEVKALSSDTRNFDLFAGSVNFAADAFQTFAGAAALAGASEEQVAEQIRTLVAIQSVANGVKGIANELTTKGTAANQAFAFTQNLIATSLDRTAAAGARAKAALGLFAIAATIIGAVVIAYNLYNRRLSEAEQRQKDLSDAMKEANKSAGQEIANLNVLYKVATNTSLSYKERKKAVDELQAQYPEHFKNINQEIILQGKAKDAYDATKVAILEAAKASAIQGKLTAIATQELDALQEEIDLKNKLVTANKAVSDQAAKAAGETGPKGAAASFGPETQNLRLLQSETKGYEARLKANQEFQTKLQKDREFFESKITTVTRTGGGGGGSATQAERDLAKERLDIFTAQKEKEADIQRQIVEIESFSLNERLQASRDYVAIKTQIIDAEFEYEKNKKDATDETIRLAEAKRLQAISALADESRALFKSNVTAAVESVKEEFGELPDEVKAVFDKMNAEFIEGSKNLLGELTEAQKKALETITKNFEEKQQLEELKNIYIDTYQSIADAGAEIFTGIFDRQKNAVQDQIDNVDKLKAAEIDRITASGDSEEKKAARIKLVEAKAQADREALARRQREIDRQKAIAQKAYNVFSLTIDGIQAVTKAKLLAQEARAKYLALGGPANPLATGFGIAAALAQAQVFQTIVTSAAAVVAAAAAPIPKFAKGKTASDSYEGLGLAGEAGREIHISKEGKASMISKPTLLNLRKGDTILPNRVTEDMIRAAHNDRLQLMNIFTGGQPISDGTSQAIKEQTEILKRIEKKPSVIIQTNPAVETTAWFHQTFKN